MNVTIENWFREWLGKQWPDGNTRWHQDDLEEAFAAGWFAALEHQGDIRREPDGR